MNDDFQNNEEQQTDTAPEQPANTPEPNSTDSEHGAGDDNAPAEEAREAEALVEESPAPETAASESQLTDAPAEEEAQVVSLDGAAVEEEKDDGVPDQLLRSRLESLIFVSQEPISVRKLAKILAAEGTKVRELAEQLIEDYQGRGILLQEVAGGFQFRTNPSNASVIQHIFKVKPLRLGRSALETLAIVAYRQPLTRAEVEEIRGVDSGGTLKHLFEKNMVRVLGRREGPGRPVIYGTSPGFLELFGLKSLSDLPPLHEFSDLWDEHQEMVDREAPLEEGELPTPISDANAGSRSLSDAISEAPLPPTAPAPLDAMDDSPVPEETPAPEQTPAPEETPTLSVEVPDDDSTEPTAEEMNDDPTAR